MQLSNAIYENEIRDYFMKNVRIQFFFFWSLFFFIWIECKNLLSKCLYFVWITKNADWEKLWIRTLFT